ncbi:hypothetical protein G3R49_00575 [Shewanella sp. WXL01]|uniref:hypothetical protein n=1 Tax=Shewanella sp. WXL01 TaxID=2709721 RepID=UPI0014385414|nr:hypothetical protein [Shewanella sp. WXL01]NKF49069.1 hypothetical protein [Shewanella sp. WXL01]
MFQISAVLLTLIGVILIYVTTRHQRLLSAPHPRIFAALGCCILMLALLSWMQLLTTIAAIFTWVFTVITLMMCVPFSTLLKPKEGR